MKAMALTAWKVFGEYQNNHASAKENDWKEPAQDDGPDYEVMEVELDFTICDILIFFISDSLNLVSAADANNANETEAYKKLSRSAFSQSKAP